MAQDQRVAERIGQRADADLQRAAVAHQCAGVQADGVVGVCHGLARQREQTRRGGGMFKHDVEKSGRHRAGAVEPWQVRVNFGDQHRSRFAQANTFVEQVEAEVGVAAQAQARAAGFARDLLHQGIGATRRDRAGDMGVVEADVVALGTGRALSNADTKNSAELGFLKLRYKSPGESESQLIETPIIDGRAENSGDAKFAAAIAGFGQLLRGDTKYLGSWFYPDAIALAHSATGADQYGYRAEAVQLMKKVSAIDLTDNSFIDPSNLPRDTPMVQLGAFESARIAKSEWAWISRQFESYFEGKGPVIQRRATSGGKVFYRLRAVGFEDMDAARRFCSLLKAENIDCIRVAAR